MIIGRMKPDRFTKWVLVVCAVLMGALIAVALATTVEPVVKCLACEVRR